MNFENNIILRTKLYEEEINVKVRVIYKKKKGKRYLAELIGDEHRGWKGKKILITAPTGMGKSTFVVENLLDSVKWRKCKTLILCNRRLLRMQYWYDLVRKFDSYGEIKECVEIMTYQQLAEMMKHQIPLEKAFDGYETIVCDESHFFYSDSDFNGFGTYALLQEIVSVGAMRTIVFMSATMDEVKPLIIQTLQNGLNRLLRTGRNTNISSTNQEILDYDYSELADFDRFRCICVPDWETLCEKLAESPQKSVVFLNDKEKGASLAEMLIKTGKIEKDDITILNADNIDSNSEAVQHLAISHRLVTKIIITTAVLDNGVSMQDPEVGNVVIETESKIEFIQMFGRVRAESVDDCKLYFVQRDEKIFFNRKNRYETEVERLKKLTARELKMNRNFYIQTLWDGDEMAKFYRKVLVWMKFDSQLYRWPENESIRENPELDLYVNEFAKCKIQNMYKIESSFYALAMQDPLLVIYEQMAWIGKEPDELQVIESTYHKMREQEFIDFLLSVENYSVDDMKEFKRQLVKRFRKDFFDDILANNGTISNEKLQEVCKRYGLILEDLEDTENRRKMYSIKCMKSEQKEEDG